VEQAADWADIAEQAKPYDLVTDDTSYFELFPWWFRPLIMTVYVALIIPRALARALLSVSRRSATCADADRSERAFLPSRDCGRCYRASRRGNPG
jgi:hypothetical protein